MKRNYLIDNTKLFLVFFVVFGHLIENLIGSNVELKIIYLIVYSFHMPMFAFISGMFSRREINKEDIFKIINSTIIPLIVFQFFYETFQVAATGKLSNYTIHLQPYWILWYLLSLFCWKLMLPIISHFKFPVVISFIIPVIAGYSSMSLT